MTELSELQTYGEPGAMVYMADCVDLMQLMPENSVDVIFADPPYRLSNNGLTCKNGRLASVNKGEWDRSMGFEEDHKFNVRWLKAARRVLKPEGTLWVTGTHHIVFSLGFAMQRLGYRIINSIAWYKPDAAPNILHTAFMHSHETVIWAAKEKRTKYKFNYDLINSLNPGRQMSSVWGIHTVPRQEKRHGYHPTQKPLRLLRRILLASTDEGGLVFDPFTGSGTTAVAAKELNRAFVGAELEEEFARLAGARISGATRGSLLRKLDNLPKLE